MSNPDIEQQSDADPHRPEQAHMSRVLGPLVALLLVLTACGAGASPSATPAGEATSAPPTGGEASATAMTDAASASMEAGDVVEITVGTDDGGEPVFVPTDVTVPAGATVRLTFVNESDSIPHNLTFSRTGPIDTATASIVQPGEQETIEFTAPEPGDYPFMCTLHPGMNGTLIVEQA